MKKFLFYLGIIFTQGTAAQTWKYPETPACDSIQSYHDKEVFDEYQWLEQDTAKETKDWVLYQQKTTESFLREIKNKEKIEIALDNYMYYEKLMSPQLSGNKLYFFKQQRQQNQPILYEKNTINQKEKVVLDPNAMSEEGLISVGDIQFSPDHKYMSYTVSRSGSDWKTIYVQETTTGKLTGDSIRYIKFTGVSWDNKGFYYTGFANPKSISKPQNENEMESKVYYHSIQSNQEKDKLIYEDLANPRYGKNVSTNQDGSVLVVSQSKGIASNLLFIKTKNATHWKSLQNNYKHNYQVVECDPNTIWVLTNENAPNNKLIAINALKPDQVKIIIPESNLKLNWVRKIGKHLLICYIKDAGEQIVHFDIQGQKMASLNLPGIGNVSGFQGEEKDTICFFTYSSFLTPSAIYKYNLLTKTTQLYIEPNKEFDLSGFEMKQEFYKDQKGNSIPIFLVHKKGIELNGKNPLFLYGYGGFNISMIPNFNPLIFPFIERGGIYAMVCLKGGGEFGNLWHQAGMLKNKPEVFNDFIATAEYLIKRGYTNSRKLAIHGRSNGGLLVGASINKRPDLFKVAIGTVGVYDMLRYHKFTVGWTWATEYGVSDSADMFDTLFGYSPYHQVKEQNYPATMLLTADHDDRVVPMHTYKFGAKLQRMNKSEYPILIRVDRNAGHGAGKPLKKTVQEWKDIWSFVFYYLNM